MGVDADRLAELLDAHAAALELYAAQWTCAPEDCVQEAFVELARQPVEPEKIRAWLFRVVRNRALNAVRGERRRRQREEAATRLRLAAVASPTGQGLDSQAVGEALERIGGPLREVTVLRVWSGLSFEEIAAVVGCSVSTAYRRYHQALEELRTILEPKSCSTNSKTNSPQN